MKNYKEARLFDAEGDLHRRWFVFYYFRDPATGKFRRFRQWISTRAESRTQRQAVGKELVKKINRKLEKGFNPFTDQNIKTISVAEGIDEILALKEQYTRKRTYNTYNYSAQRLKEFINEQHLGDLPIDDFSSFHAQRFMDHLKRRGISNRTHNYSLMHVRGFFNMALDREWIQVNPFAKIKKLPVADTDIIAYTDEERELIRTKLPVYNFDLWIVAGLIFYCFLRPQEIVRLRVRHFRLKEGVINVPGTIAKGKKTYTIDIPDQFLEDLRNFNLKYPSDYYVFSTHLQRGKNEISPIRIAEEWKAFRETIGIRKGIYALKHTGNGLAANQGIPVRDLQLHNRHHSLSMTQAYLDRFSRKASDRIIHQFPSF